MPVAPAVAAFLDKLNHVITPALLAAGYEPNAINVREGLARLTLLAGAGPEHVATRDGTLVGGDYNVPVRMFDPAPNERLPVLIYFHGGGGMAGSVTVYDPILRRLADATRHIVIAPEYRLAPENPYPAGQIDALSTLQFCRQMLDKRPNGYVDEISIGGDSAGGAISATLARLATESGHSIARQILVYPSLDFTMSQPSIDSLGKGYLLEKARIRWYFEQYFPHQQDYAAASPLLNPIPAGYPATLILTGGFDPLRDEGEAFARRLQAAQAPCLHHCYDDLIHAFLNIQTLCPEQCMDAYARMGEFLNAKNRFQAA